LPQVSDDSRQSTHSLTFTKHTDAHTLRCCNLWLCVNVRVQLWVALNVAILCRHVGEFRTDLPTVPTPEEKEALVFEGTYCTHADQSRAGWTDRQTDRQCGHSEHSSLSVSVCVSVSRRRPRQWNTCPFAERREGQNRTPSHLHVSESTHNRPVRE